MSGFVSDNGRGLSVPRDNTSSSRETAIRMLSSAVKRSVDSSKLKVFRSDGQGLLPDEICNEILPDGPFLDDSRIEFFGGDWVKGA
jgi:hypothetical protein